LATDSSDKKTPITKRVLIGIRNRSKRRGVWWKISKSERALIHLAIGLKVKLTSDVLLKALSSIIKKLCSLLKSSGSTLGKGARLAWLFSEKACEWGYSEALLWRYDCSYIEYLGKAFT
jgi:hypothetical protein